MSDIKNDKMAERVKKRQEAAGLMSGTPAISPLQQEIIESVDTAKDSSLEDLKRELVGGDNDDIFASAKRIATARARGVPTGDIAAVLGFSKAWVSKRLALLDATPEMAEKIRSGAIAATDFYNRARASNNTGHRQYVRQPAVAIHVDTARALIEILAILAQTHGITGIRLDKPLNKRELAAALNLRAQEIRGLL